MEVRRQGAGGGVDGLGAACVVFCAYFDQEIDGVLCPVFFNTSSLGAFSTKGWGEQRGRGHIFFFLV